MLSEVNDYDQTHLENRMSRSVTQAEKIMEEAALSLEQELMGKNKNESAPWRWNL